MSKKYIEGFLVKCAQHGLPYEDAKTLCKQALWGASHHWDDVGQQMRDYKAWADAQGLDMSTIRSILGSGHDLVKGLESAKNGKGNLNGTWFSRHLVPWSDNATDSIRSNAAAFNELKQRWLEIQKQRQATQPRPAPAAPAPAPATPSVIMPTMNERRRLILEGRIPVPNVAGYHLDNKTLKQVREGNVYNNEAELWNAQLDAKEDEYQASLKAAQPPKPAPTPAPAPAPAPQPPAPPKPLTPEEQRAIRIKSYGG